VISSLPIRWGHIDLGQGASDCSVIKKALIFIQPSGFRIDLPLQSSWFNARVFSHYDFVMCVDACGMRHRDEATAAWHYYGPGGDEFHSFAPVAVTRFQLAQA
jgi:hypothetical protein